MSMIRTFMISFIDDMNSYHIICGEGMIFLKFCRGRYVSSLNMWKVLDCSRLEYVPSADDHNELRYFICDKCFD